MPPTCGGAAMSGPTRRRASPSRSCSPSATSPWAILSAGRYPLFRQEHLDPPQPESPLGGQIRFIRSTDRGKTWSEARVLADTPHDDRDANLCQLADGRVLCTWFAIWRWPGRGYDAPPPGEKAQYALF